jgi:outer membrane protein OmpA-like peptidoglycan-associated protein
MKSRFVHLTFLLLAAGTTVSAQHFTSPKKGSLLGVSFDMVDFVTPARIRSNGLGHVIDHGEWAKWKDHDLGFSVMYWQGISNRLDLSVQYNGLFSDHLKNSPSQQYVNEGEAAFHLRALKDDHALNPFLTAGIGAGYYGSHWAGYTPLGIGVQANIRSSVYLLLQANYRWSFARHVIDDNLFYSLGVAKNLSRCSQHPARPTPVPVPAVVDVDKDKDGIADSTDACPDVAGLKAFQGCPDSDGDGVPDKDDRCPGQPGLVKYNGCPIPDSDGDGVNDENDKCPSVEGVARYNGCPIPDSDGDGVNDEMDKCPAAAGPASNHGCPEVKQEVIEKATYAAKHIFFSSGKATLLPKSYTALNDVAALMKDNPALHLDIEGYTDNTGDAATNLKLSQSRADAVRAYLVKKKVDSGRMTATGFGQDSPVADNKRAAGRAKNRRVELKLRTY